MRYLLSLIIITFLSSGAYSQSSKRSVFPEDTEIGIVEKLDEYVPDDIMIMSSEGEWVNLMSLVER
jgi:hypothetical protein